MPTTTGMPLPRLLAPAVITAALSAALPASASAGLVPVWQPAQTVSDGNDAASYPLVASAPSGKTVVRWEQSDGLNDRIVARLRAADGTWGDARFVSEPGQEADGSQLPSGIGDDGIATLSWFQSGIAQISVLGPDGTWGQAAPLAEQGAQPNSITMAPSPDGGTTILATGSVNGEERVRVYERAAGTLTYSVTEEWDEPGNYAVTSPSIDFNASGDAIATWRLDTGGSDELRFSRHRSGAWEPAGTALTEVGTQPIAVLSNAGAAAVIWADSTYSHALTATMDTSGNWSSSHQMANDQPNVYFPTITADASGTFIAAWQSFDMLNYMTVPAHAVISEWTEQTGSWSPPSPLDGAFSGVPTLATNAAGDTVLAWAGGTGMASIKVMASFRPNGGTWSTGQELDQGLVDVGANGVLSATVNGVGNAAIAFLDPDTPARTAAVVLGDGAAPDIDALTIPSSVTVGQPLSVSVDASDTLSGVAGVSWTFGDGAAAEGESASHTYTTPGTRTVTVTVTDGVGHASTETHQIVVSAPPAPPASDDDEDTVVDDVKPKPPTVTAPVIDAKLAGKTITYSTKISLKKGKSCSGKVEASFRYGNKRYKSTLKLKKVGKDCRATGKTTLKKTPGARTKITIKITGKTIKTRSLATKRG